MAHDGEKFAFRAGSRLGAVKGFVKIGLQQLSIGYVFFNRHEVDDGSVLVENRRNC